jgi:hypothetical protein
MRRQNGKEGGVATSWEGELPRYTPPNKIMEMEVEALLAWMVAIQGRTSSIVPLKSGGN